MALTSTLLFMQLLRLYTNGFLNDSPLCLPLRLRRSQSVVCFLQGTCDFQHFKTASHSSAVDPALLVAFTSAP